MAYRPASQTFTQAFHGKRVKLIGAMLVTHRLLNHLQDKKLLTGQHVAQIMDKLLRILEKRDNTLFPEFLAALIADEQGHVVRDHFMELAPRFVDLGIQVSIEDNYCHSKAFTNVASQTDRSLIDMLTLSRSEIRRLFFSNQEDPVHVGVQTSWTIPPSSQYPRYPASVADVGIQAHVEPQTQTATTQTDNNFSDHCPTEVHRILRRVSNEYDYEYDCGPLDRLPIELLEYVLMRTFTRKFTEHYKSQYKTYEAVQLAYSTLASVCNNWWQTVNGWPQSSTKHWFEHRIRRAVQTITRPYSPWPYQQSSLRTLSLVRGITHCDNKLFVVCHESDSISVFGPNNEQQIVVNVTEMKEPHDIVACSETRQLYVAGESRDSRCVWKVSLSDLQFVKWLPNKTTVTSQFRPWSLSLTSRRLLVTSKFEELLLYGPDGSELKRVSLPDMELLHAMETPRETFIVSHRQPQPQVSEINADGHTICVYNGQLELSRPDYLSLDSDGRVFVTDTYNDRVLMLNSGLKVERIMLDAEHDSLVRYPRRVHYVQQTGQLVVGSSDNYFQIFQLRN